MKRPRRFAAPLLFLALASLQHPSALASMLSGTVTDDAGQAAAKAEVALEPVEGQGTRTSTLTSKMGTFLLDNVTAGKYRVSVRTEGKTLLSLAATAERQDKSVAWKIEGGFDPSKPPVLDVADGLVQAIRGVTNPDKLAHLGPVANVREVLRRNRG